MGDPLAHVDSVLHTRLKVGGEYVYHCYGLGDEATCQMEGRRLQDEIKGLECMVVALEDFPQVTPTHDPAQVLPDPWGRCC